MQSLARIKTISILSSFALGIFSLHTVAVSLPSLPVLAAFTECADGIDNDRDGLTDYPHDGNCTSFDDDSEGTAGGLFISLTDNAETVKPGGKLTYTISVNVDRQDQQIADVRFLIPSRALLFGMNPAGERTGQYVTWKNVTLDPGNIKKFFVDLEVDQYAKEGDIVTAEAVVRGQYGRDSTRVSGKTSYNSRGDELFVTISDGRKEAEREEILTYKIVVENRGNVERNFDVRASLPPALIFTGGSGFYDKDNRSVIWRGEYLPAHSKKEYIFSGIVERETRKNVVLYTKASVENKIAADTTVIGSGLPPLAIALSFTDGKKSAKPGEFLDYQIVLKNRSKDPAVHIDVNAALPLYTEFVNATEGGYWTGNNIGWKDLTIVPGGERVLLMRLRIESDAPVGAVVRGSVYSRGITAVDVTDIGKSSLVGQSSSRARIVVRQPVERAPVVDAPYYAVSPVPVVTRSTPAALIRKSANRSEAKPGDTVFYTVTFTNVTGHRVENIEIEDTIDSGTAIVKSAPGASVNGDTIRWTIAGLNAGESWTRKYSVVIEPTVPHGTVIGNIVTVSGDGLEAVALNTRTSIFKIGVVENLPDTGVPLDGIFLGLTSMIAMAPVVRRKK